MIKDLFVFRFQIENIAFGNMFTVAKMPETEKTACQNNQNHSIVTSNWFEKFNYVSKGFRFNESPMRIIKINDFIENIIYIS